MSRLILPENNCYDKNNPPEGRYTNTLPVNAVRKIIILSENRPKAELLRLIRSENNYFKT